MPDQGTRTLAGSVGNYHRVRVPVVNKHGIGTGKLDVGSVGRIFKRAVVLSGRDAAEYSSHSGRAGFVTSAAIAGMPAFQISQVTGHKGIQSLQKYMRVIEQRRIASLL